LEKYRKMSCFAKILGDDFTKRIWQKGNTAWQQLLLAPQSSKLVEKAYNLYGIPDFLLIDAQGKVVFATSSPDELDEEVGKALR
jgi:hypothetical protein